MNNKIVYIFFGFMYLSCADDQEKEISNPTKPNIIFIISDDQTYSDYSFMGHPFIKTPHIDRLSTESMTFTRGYATAPLCSPSLASIITGLYAFQHGITGNDPVVEFEGGKSYAVEAKTGNFLPQSYPVQRDKVYRKLASNFYKNELITQTLSGQGYHSFQTGKWWVGSAQDAGFDKGMTHGDYNRGGRHGDEGLKIGREGMQPIYDFIEESKVSQKPFFIWHAPFLPHTPHNPPKALEEKYLKLAPSPYVAKYWAMVEWFDQTTGELLDHIRAQGLEENTIIVYTADNGWIQSPDRNGYEPRSKRAPHEGGIRTPIMFKYPQRIPTIVDTQNVVSNVDIVPTILGLLGLDKGKLPGVNVMDKQALQNRKVVFAEAYDHDIANIEVPTESILYKIAVGKKWKLLLPNKHMVEKDATTISEKIAGYYSKSIQLYNLENDPAELINVAEKYPNEVQQLSTAIENWWQPN